MTLLLLGLLLTHLTIASVSIYLHRSLAHRALTLHPALVHLIRLYLWLGTGINTTTWVGVHRKHHRYVDAAGDPHSPHLYGLWNVLVGGTFLYLHEGSNPIAMQAYARGCPTDWLERNVYRQSKLGPFIGMVLLTALLGLGGWIIWLVNYLWIPFWGAGVVNGVGHWLGYRNTDTKDYSTNIFPIGLIMAGEELHNNHHANPASAKLSVKWYEFDAGWLWIRLLSFVGLARVHAAPSRD